MISIESHWIVFGFAMTTAGMACALSCVLMIHVNNCYSRFMEDRNEYFRITQKHVEKLEGKIEAKEKE